jgi:hypothetical protein
VICTIQAPLPIRFAERLLTVVASCGQHRHRLLNFLVAAVEAKLQGTPPLSLLPASYITDPGVDR